MKFLINSLNEITVDFKILKISLRELVMIGNRNFVKYGERIETEKIKSKSQLKSCLLVLLDKTIELGTLSAWNDYEQDEDQNNKTIEELKNLYLKFNVKKY